VVEEEEGCDGKDAPEELTEKKLAQVRGALHTHKRASCPHTWPHTTQRPPHPSSTPQRQRQIELGYATAEYAEYCAAVPRAGRRLIGAHPATPDRFAPISKRRFTGQVKAWRKALHMAYPGQAATPAELEAAVIADAAPVVAAE
jgi:hypothetical protein